MDAIDSLLQVILWGLLGLLALLVLGWVVVLAIGPRRRRRRTHDDGEGVLDLAVDALDGVDGVGGTDGRERGPGERSGWSWFDGGGSDGGGSHGGGDSGGGGD